MPIHAQSTIAEIDSALAEGTCTLAQARKVLSARSKRDSASGRRAAAWLAAHKPTPAKAAAKAAPKAKKGPNPRTVRANASGEAPGSTGWWDAYHARNAYAPVPAAVKRLGAEVFDGLELTDAQWAELAEAVKSIAA